MPTVVLKTCFRQTQMNSFLLLDPIISAYKIDSRVSQNQCFVQSFSHLNFFPSSAVKNKTNKEAS